MNLEEIQIEGLPQRKKINFHHYLRLIVEKKWWILSIALLVSIIWFFLYPVFFDRSPHYYFTAIIRFDDPRIAQSASGVDDRFTRMETESKIRVINTTSFLSRLVENLSLNVILNNRELSREEFFSSIKLDMANVQYGRYKLQRKNGQIEIYFTNKQENKDNYLIGAVPLDTGSLVKIDVQGISAAIYATVFDEIDQIEFSCIPTRYILENLRAGLNLDLNRQQTLLTIGYKHRDPLLGPRITNAIADLFLEQSLEFKRSRTSGALMALEEQLRSSKEQLEKVEEELRDFREENPNIYLAENIAEFNRIMTLNEIERDQIRNNLQRLNQLVEEKNNITGASALILVYKEVLTFLQEQNVSGIIALNQQYATLMTQHNQLVEQNFSDDHPRMVEINRLIHSMHQTIDDRTAQYLSIQNTRLNQLVNTIRQSERRIRQSPEKELQLAKLQRERSSKEQVYTSVLLRYNEIKTAHAATTPDAYLLESAQIPVVYFSIWDSIMNFFKVMIGPFLGLLLGVFIFLVLDSVWHTAHSEEDIERLLKLPVLSTIPLLKVEKADEVTDIGKKIDPLLVTIDYKPSMGGEAFRNLRARLVIDKDKDERQKIIVTSLMPNEGKSLVAANLAVTFAQIKMSTLIIDADVRRGVMHNSFVCTKTPGLTDLLAKGPRVTRESIKQNIQKTSIPNLSLLPSGSSVPNPAELLISDRIEKILQLLEKQFNYIIIDSPPIEFIPDAFVINKSVRNMIVVTRYARTNLNELKKRLVAFPDMSETIRGIVLNASTDVLGKRYQAYSYYKY